MSRHPTPAREGHWWAKLKLAENPDDNSVNWEVVQVFDNNGEGEEAFMASVPGIERGQRLDAFVWGPPVHMPAELARPDGASSRHTQTETATGSEQNLILSLTKEVEGLREALKWALPLAKMAMETHRIERMRYGHTMTGTYRSGETWVGIYQSEVDEIERANDALSTSGRAET